ncbi:flagellar motor protein MotB [Calidifontibacillus erzurumensis]|uniref:Flagellar motor protein MotB n=1 Tax=Calidifontibacillus erzurumensis TaxID=2741433 RepID=A0A8J8GEW8_9BACI|nr:flagellar motor protein MotB [Calidifontibacillus erzurumensis]NSL52229.1 flagellar motor protein MotB [Calidifontibacillus erzurumensis]
MRNKKQKQNEDHMDETWLIPYADLLTLLLALFIVLFAMSSIDLSKFSQMARSFNSTFQGGTGVMQYPSPFPQDDVEGIENKKVKIKNNEQKKLYEQALLEQQQMIELKEKIDTYIQSKNLSVQLNTSLSDEGLMLTLRNDILFDSGTADVKPEYYQVAREISQLLEMEEPREIIISGHTDNVPIHNAQFDSNWHLSVMRAVNFMKILLENENLNAKWFSAKGYGEFRPIASNATPEGRAANRRVEILIKAIKNEETSN